MYSADKKSWNLRIIASAKQNASKTSTLPGQDTTEDQTTTLVHVDCQLYENVKTLTKFLL